MVTSQEQSYKHALSHTPSLKASCVAVSADRARKRRRVGGIKVGGRGKEGGEENHRREVYICTHTHVYMPGQRRRRTRRRWRKEDFT